MTRIYANVSYARRMTASVVTIVFAVLFGFWELWMAYNAGSQGTGYGYLFAALFIGGGGYAVRQLRRDYSDTVVRFDSDSANGHGAATIWQPFKSKRIDGPLESFSNWRFTALTEPTMTTVDQPGFEMGQEAARLLIKEIEAGEDELIQPITKTLQTNLIVRRSSMKV